MGKGVMASLPMVGMIGKFAFTNLMGPLKFVLATLLTVFFGPMFFFWIIFAILFVVIIVGIVKLISKLAKG